MSCRIEQLKESDWERARDIRLRSLLETPDAFGSTYEKELQFSPEVWIERLSRQDAATFLAVSDMNQDIGLLTIAPYDDHLGLFGMWVASGARKMRVGGKLVDAAVDWARARGCLSIFLDVGDNNPAAIALYRSKGFARTGKTGSLPIPRTHILEHQRMFQF